jgi:membrane protein required for colicin V production
MSYWQGMLDVLGRAFTAINGFDLFALTVLGLCMLASAWRGAVAELFSLAGWVLAFFVAKFYAADLGRALLPQLQPELVRDAVAWVATFVVILLTAALVGAVARRIVHLGGLSLIDALLGALVGVAKAAVLLLALVWVAGYTPLVESPEFRASQAVKTGRQAIGVIKQNSGWDERRARS